MNKTKIEDSPQGVRMQGIPEIPSDKRILFPGEVFLCTKFPNLPAKRLKIPEGCIGVHHDDEAMKISVIRDDCQAARRAKTKFLKTIESK